ncbi:UvrD-helicase domain-containing protein [Paracoccus sp. MBLB3053]|uniref:UvrD-helicase domain-containing protein n=1 Tax=Paracoccus aurantius TaxID=3073814 RepID=A0ABU2HYD2_9RHOB|nr:UvrD-helicase domain-containing protein [Paracoccus sp. MBLB3053]MDS9469599.1 UvrD-helicase domain-containing protein [Paracoccus sp. MBLB3053]
MGYLQNLNEAQRQAVEHGMDPLLIIAGAGSGKTNTLAHRVAHLLKQGADPRRILLMTFSRRAASELTRRVARITESVMGTGYGAEALAWAGTRQGDGLGRTGRRAATRRLARGLGSRPPLVRTPS